MSDPELSFAHPIGNIAVHGDSFQALDEVLDIVERERVDVVVVGLPLLLDGSEGRHAHKARRWSRNLTVRANALIRSGEWFGAGSPSVLLKDERLTTVAAHRELRGAGIREKGHRPMIDQQSAVLILQSALDDARRKGGQYDG